MSYPVRPDATNPILYTQDLLTGTYSLVNDLTKLDIKITYYERRNGRYEVFDITLLLVNRGGSNVLQARILPQQHHGNTNAHGGLQTVTVNNPQTGNNRALVLPNGHQRVKDRK